MLTKWELAHKLRLLAKLVELNGEGFYKSQAYIKVAEGVERLKSQPSVENVFLLPSVGVGIGSKLREFLKTGTCEKLEQLQTMWGSLTNLMRIPGIGPAKARFFYQQYKATTKEDIQKLINKGIITDKRIIEGMTEVEAITFNKALSTANALMSRIFEVISDNSLTVYPAGSLRRKSAYVKDLDFVVKTEDKEFFKQQIRMLFESVSNDGDSKIAGLYHDVHCDIRFAEEEYYGAMLLHFTGSKEHNIKLRQCAIAKQLRLNEYGLWRGETRIAGATEQEIFTALGLQYKEPEDRL